MRFGAVLETRKSNGAVRFFVNPTVRFGAVFLFRKIYGAVRCGLGKNPTVRCGAVNRTETHQTDRKNRTVKNPGIFGFDMYHKRLYFGYFY